MQVTRDNGRGPVDMGPAQSTHWRIPHASDHDYHPNIIPDGEWIADRKAPKGFRQIRVLEVTLPHDCGNHLEGDGNVE